MSNDIPEANRSNENAPPLDRMKQEMDRWIDAAKSTGERALETLGILGGSRPSVPAIDVLELANQIVVVIDLPGVSAESVELSLTGNMLSVKGLRPGYPSSNETPPRIHLSERVSLRFERAIPLPAAVNADAIRAETRDGVLTISLDKATAPPSRSIPVTRGPAAS
jgi:HSP20 family protein